MPVKGRVSKTVRLNLVPLERADNESKYRLVNVARDGGATLGILKLIHEEVEYFMDKMIVDSVEASSYQQWVTIRLSNPSRYVIDGQRLSDLPVAQQLHLINREWDSTKELPDPAQRQVT